MKVEIHPDYEHLRDWVEGIPGSVPDEAGIIRDYRNVLYKERVGGETFVVKKFKRPNLFNRFVYGTFRKTKARRSFEHARRLSAMGIETAPPVAYIEIRKGGLFHTGYFISANLSYPLLKEAVEHPDREKIWQDFALFTADLHRRGVNHRDYNTENIFFRKNESGNYVFALIDINRMTFRPLSKRKCVDSLKRLGLPLSVLVRIMERYTEVRGWNTEVWCGTLLLKRGVDLRGRIKQEAKHIKNSIKGFFEDAMTRYAH